MPGRVPTANRSARIVPPLRPRAPWRPRRAADCATRASKSVKYARAARLAGSLAASASKFARCARSSGVRDCRRAGRGARTRNRRNAASQARAAQRRGFGAPFRRIVVRRDATCQQADPLCLARAEGKLERCGSDEARRLDVVAAVVGEPNSRARCAPSASSRCRAAAARLPVGERARSERSPASSCRERQTLESSPPPPSRSPCCARRPAASRYAANARSIQPVAIARLA